MLTLEITNIREEFPVSKFQKGINLGGWFSQCDYTEERYMNFIGTGDLDWIESHGFDHVRLPIDYEFLEDDKRQIIKNHIALLENVIEECAKRNLDVILDLHKAPGYDFNTHDENNNDPLFTLSSVQDRFICIWIKLSKIFGVCENVAFELLNEVVNPEYSSVWNKLIERAAKAIRENCNNLIIYGGVEWNSAKRVKELVPPPVSNMMITFHYYEPLIFTHQKAYWVKGMDPEEVTFYPEKTSVYKDKSVKLGCQGTAVMDVKTEEIGESFHEDFIMEAIESAKEKGAELYCGEFGVIDRAPSEDTFRWYKDVLNVFKKHEIGCALWSYKEMDFGLSSEHYREVIEKLI